MNTKKSKLPVEATGNFISILPNKDSPYSLQEIEEILLELKEEILLELKEGEDEEGSLMYNADIDEEGSLMYNADIPVIVNYSIVDPVSNGKVTKSGSLTPDLTNGVSFSLNIKIDRPDNIHFIPHQTVMEQSMGIKELIDLLRTTDRFNKSREALHINYLDRFQKTCPRHVGVVDGLGFIRIHHSQGVPGVFVLNMKVQESPWV